LYHKAKPPSDTAGPEDYATDGSVVARCGKALDLRLTRRVFNFLQPVRFYVTSVNSALHPSGVAKSHICRVADDSTLCDPLWHVSFP